MAALKMSAAWRAVVWWIYDIVSRGLGVAQTRMAYAPRGSNNVPGGRYAVPEGNPLDLLPPGINGLSLPSPPAMIFYSCRTGLEISREREREKRNIVI